MDDLCGTQRMETDSNLSHVILHEATTIKKKELTFWGVANSDMIIKEDDVEGEQTAAKNGMSVLCDCYYIFACDFNVRTTSHQF